MIQPEPEGSTQGYPVVSVEVLRYDKRSKSENMGIVPTEMELILEHTQQGISHEVSLSRCVGESGDEERRLEMAMVLHVGGCRDGSGGEAGEGEDDGGVGGGWCRWVVDLVDRGRKSIFGGSPEKLAEKLFRRRPTPQGAAVVAAVVVAVQTEHHFVVFSVAKQTPLYSTSNLFGLKLSRCGDKSGDEERRLEMAMVLHVGSCRDGSGGEASAAMMMTMVV
uniref:Uncharacterized protein n=1 Tax=Tanacetum cinerariifolium TaxID=118510 RepID=A0A6L2MY96_TANCI|nr:hypothetical protein [Tanacetum cinerariifolium]